MEELRIPEKHGLSFVVDAGETFHVTDPEGQQVADLVAFSRTNTDERFSPKYTYRRENKLRPTTGDTLYTTEGNEILRIVDDDCGVHDLLYAPCNHWVVGEYYGQEGQGGCRENLAEVLAPAEIDETELQETMNVFMKSEVTNQTHVEIAEPESAPGDTITFEAQMDTVVGVAACSGESTVNAGGTKPIDVTMPDGALLERNF
jgi:hypothetical protein